MATFMSGTDTNTLLEEGSERNHFVSLIVNNKGTYTAGITRKVTAKLTEELTYISFDGKPVEASREYEETQYVEWFDLEIEKEGEAVPFRDSLFSRFDEIAKTKEEAAKKKKSSNFYGTPKQTMYPSAINPNFTKDKAFTQGTQGVLFEPATNEDDYDTLLAEAASAVPEDPYINPTGGTLIGKTSSKEADAVLSESPKGSLGIDFDTAPVNSKAIKDSTVKLLTGNVLATSTSINLKKAADKMKGTFDKTFDSFPSFVEFIEPFVDWVVTNSEAIPFNTTTQKWSLDEKYAIIAYKIKQQILLANIPSNIYKTKIIEQLNIYIEV